MKDPHRRGTRRRAGIAVSRCEGRFARLVANHSTSSLDEVFSFPPTILQNWSAGRIARARFAGGRWGRSFLGNLRAYDKSATSGDSFK